MFSYLWIWLKGEGRTWGITVIQEDSLEYWTWTHIVLPHWKTRKIKLYQVRSIWFMALPQLICMKFSFSSERFFPVLTPLGFQIKKYKDISVETLSCKDIQTMIKKPRECTVWLCSRKTLSLPPCWAVRLFYLYINPRNIKHCCFHITGFCL